MRNDFESNYLMHHGILGMKWGKKNGPPYPLDGPDHSASEKKAGYKKSIGGGRNEELYGKKKSTKKQISVSSNSTKENENPSDKKKGLTDKQKTAIKVGAAVAATALVAYGGYKLSNNAQVRELIKTGIKKSGSIAKSTTEIPKMDIPKVEIPKTEIPKVNVTKTSISNTLTSKPPANTPTLSFGSSNETFSKSDMDRLMNNADKLMKAATSSTKPSASTESLDYAKELLEKNMKKLN